MAEISKQPEVVSSDEGDIFLRYDELSRRRRRRRFLCIAIAVTVTLTILSLAATMAVLLWPRQPAIYLGGARLNPTALLGNSTMVQLTLAMTVWNPNRSSFSYGNTMGGILYHGEKIGDAAFSGGEITGRGRRRFPVNVSIDVESLLENPNFSADLDAGWLPMESATLVTGTVDVLGLFKHHARIEARCRAGISLTTDSVDELGCKQKTSFGHH